MPLWTKEREAGIQDLVENQANLQVEKKEQICGKQIFAVPSRNNGTQRAVQETGYARFRPVCHNWISTCKTMKLSHFLILYIN